MLYARQGCVGLICLHGPTRAERLTQSEKREAFAGELILDVDSLWCLIMESNKRKLFDSRSLINEVKI
jgi:hypothetical protein